MGSITKQYKGAGPAGAGETAAIGPGKSMEARGRSDQSNFPTEASSGKGIKPKNVSIKRGHRGESED